MKTQILDDNGTDTGATFTAESIGGTMTIRFHSRGTSEGTRAYRAGMALLLSRLAGYGIGVEIEVTDVCVETRTTGALSRSERRIFKASKDLPSLGSVVLKDSAETVRKRFHTAAAKVGRPEGAKGGGNGTKQLRFYLRTELDAETIAARLGEG